MTLKLSKALFVFLFSFTVVSLYAQDNLDNGIEKEARYILSVTPADSILAIVSVKSDNPRLTDYIIIEMEDYIVNNRNTTRKNITIVDRQQLDIIRREINFQYSGEVSEETMVRIGRMLGAQIIVTGSVMDAGDSYNFNIRLLDVETAKILGSNSIRIIHDDMMDGFLPNSNAALARKRQAQDEFQKQEKTKDTVKKTLGIFSSGYYIGYIGSLDTPIGISFGGINEDYAFFIDTEIGPPDYDGISRSDLSYLGTTVVNQPLGNLYRYDDSTTYLKLDLLVGINVKLIQSFLWFNAGCGFEFTREHKLFTEISANGQKQMWLKDGKENDHFNLAVSAGLLVKIWYFYVQGKYKYVFGSELETDNYGLHHFCLGVGFTWRVN